MNDQYAEIVETSGRPHRLQLHTSQLARIFILPLPALGFLGLRPECP